MSAIAAHQRYDAAGDPICAACQRPIRPDDSFARVEFRMLHLRCWTEMPEDTPPR